MPEPWSRNPKVLQALVVVLLLGMAGILAYFFLLATGDGNPAAPASPQNSVQSALPAPPPATASGQLEAQMRGTVREGFRSSWTYTMYPVILCDTKEKTRLFSIPQSLPDPETGEMTTRAPTPEEAKMLAERCRLQALLIQADALEGQVKVCESYSASFLETRGQTFSFDCEQEVIAFFAPRFPEGYKEFKTIRELREKAQGELDTVEQELGIRD